jgi:SAM-dependent methyltransferase
MSDDAIHVLAGVVEFYDGLADDYHLVYGDRWDEAVDRQGVVLDRLIRAHSAAAVDVLDCACGIGTQAIGLARRGYRVTGSDISRRGLQRAGAEASRLGVQLGLIASDFRHLSNIDRHFDVVVCCDNAIPHLLDDCEVDLAFAAMRSKLRPGGLLIVSVRDYDRALIERPVTSSPTLIAGPPRRVVVRLHDWDGPASPLYTVRFLILTETSGEWSVAHHATRYRAINTADLTQSAERAGLQEIRWHNAADLGFHQPVMTATRSEL